MKENTMKKLIAILMALCMILSMSACGSNAGSSTAPAAEPSTEPAAAPSPTAEEAAAPSPAAAEPRTSVTVSMLLDNTSFDPMLSMSLGSLYNRQLFEALIREESDGSLVPGLAESWEMADDHLSVDFKIREGVKFHNGAPLTAEDVAFSLNRAITDSHMDFTVYMKQAEVLDDTHVRLTMNSVYSDLLSSLSDITMAIVNKQAVEELGEGFGAAPVGTGPYTLDSWTTGSSIIFKAFPDYWRGEAPIKEVVCLIQPDSSTGAIALENGEVDVLNAVATADVEHLESIDGLTVYKTSAVGTTTLFLNAAGGMTQDPRVRQAIALCLDKEEYVIGVMNGFGEPADTIISKSMAYHNDDIHAPAADIEKAKALLAEAGYADGITVKYATVAEIPDLVQTGNILMGQLAKAGITLEMDIKEYSAFFNDVQSGHNFDITCATSTTNATTPGSVLSNILSTGAVNNLGQYHNDEVEKLLADANASFDDAVKQECYDRICEIVNEECPIIALCTGYNIMAANSDLNGCVCPAVTTLYFYDWSWNS